jgi:hypothetical protein
MTPKIASSLLNVIFEVTRTLPIAREISPSSTY